MKNIPSNVIDKVLHRLTPSQALFWGRLNYHTILRDLELQAPAIGVTDDNGVLNLSWAFVDHQPVFTMEIHPDGKVEWTFLHPTMATGGEGYEFPAHALNLLFSNFAKKI